MKKPLYILTAFLLVSAVIIYSGIPAEIVVSEVEQVESSERIISQYLNKPAERAKWWPKILSGDAGFEPIAFQYDFIGAGYNTSTVSISSKDFKNSSTITWTPYANNVVEIRWMTSLKASLNPIRRIKQYFQAHRIKSNMTSIMERLLGFIIIPRNVYNMAIERQVVKDTILATARFKTPTYPSTGQIYQQINSIKTYVKNQDAIQVNAPMLNISRDPEGTYQTMIALPINKQIKPDLKVLINRMVAGNILVAQVKGGPGKIKTAFNQMEVYMDDFKLSSPAIPFESLVTDRRTETDTSEWITKIYYPVY